jgi:hypothetical protein
MRTSIRESSVLPGSRVNGSEVHIEPALPGLFTRADRSATEALTWLTVGLGLLVIGLASALIVLGVVQ